MTTSVGIPAFGLLLALLLANPTMVGAHSKSETTTPANGATLEVAPDTIGMTFDKPMRITLITLSNRAGESLELTRTDNMQPVTEFVATPPGDLPDGHYTIEWRGLSADGHPMEGQFSFGIAR